MENRVKENLNYLLNKRGISQSDLADALKMPRQTVNNWVMGNTTPSAYRAQLVADYFKVSVSDLVFGDLIYTDIKEKTTQRTKDAEAARKIADTPAGSLLIEKSPDDLRQKDALRRLLAYAVLLNEGDLDMVADMAERLAGKDGKR